MLKFRLSFFWTTLTLFFPSVVFDDVGLNILRYRADISIAVLRPLLGVKLSPEFVNLYFLYAGRGLLFFCWWQQHFEFQLVCVAVEGRSNVV